MKNIRWKVFTVIGVFAVFFALGVYPILANRYPKVPAPAWLKAKQLKLGLDLRGGVHLVLRVHTDEALKTSTTTTAEQLREAARAAGINADRGDRAVADDLPRRGRAVETRTRTSAASRTRSPAPTTTGIREPAAPTISRCGRTSPCRCASRP